MIKYDEKANIARLSHLHPSSRATFSLCCATRQTTTWEEYARQFRPNDVIAFRKTAETIWNTLASNALPLNWKPTLDEVMGLFPGEESEASPLHTYAEDALASLAYVIRCLIAGSEQEAAWSARRAYEMADQAAIRQLGLQPGGSAAEKQILMHSTVQRELERQERDLQILERHPFMEALDQLRLSAFREQTLALDEINL
jgi:uncharacterized protein YjaG (DUF416 family)